MDKVNKPFYKKWWFISLVIVIIIGGIGMIYDTSIERQAGHTDKKAEAIIESLPIDEKLLKKNKRVNKAKITEDGVLTITNSPKTFFSENSIITTHTYWMLEAANEAFQDEAVKEVTASIEVELIDNKGNTSMGEVATFTYTRETFEELDYEGFLKLVSGAEWHIYNESDAYFIHPAIYNEIKDKYRDKLINANGL